MKKLSIRTKTASSGDWTNWNFIIFLTLTLMLVVGVLTAIRPIAFDLRSRASGACPDPRQTLPTSPCSGGEWKYKPDANGCYTFFCETE